MKPIHKFNNGNGATLCHNCYIIISDGLTNDLICPDCLAKLLDLKGYVGELVKMLESVEISDSEREFHPTTIQSCRCMQVARLQEIMPKISEIVKGGETKEYTQEEIDEIVNKTHYP